MNIFQSDKSQAFTDLISPSCHYTEDTLITKAGYLIQTIEISADNLGAKWDLLKNMQDNIRKSLLESICSSEIMIYLHVIRKKQPTNQYHQNTYANTLIYKINKEWCQSQKLEFEISNSLYITVVHVGIANLDNWNPLHNFFFWRLKNRNQAVLDTNMSELNECVEKVTELLHEYSPTRLAIFRKDGKYYSAPLSFCSYLLFQNECDVELEENDASVILSKNRVMRCEGRILSISKTDDKATKEIAIFTLKYPFDFSPDTLAKILNLKIEAIFTEIAIFHSSKKLLRNYQECASIYRASDAKKLIELSNINEFASGKLSANGSSFVLQQLNIILHADSAEILISYANRLQKFCNDSSIICILEDLYLPACYFANLPGNMLYTRRMIPNVASKIGIFANISNPNSGIKYGNHWGEYVCLLSDLDLELPYYFSFHNSQNIGHTLIIGNEQMSKRLANFLIANATKISPTVIGIDLNGENKSLFEILKGQNIQVFGNADDFHIDFNIKLNKEDRPLIENFILNNSLSDEQWLKCLKLCAKELDIAFFDEIITANKSVNEDIENSQENCLDTDLIRSSSNTIVKFLNSKVYKEIFLKRGSKNLITDSLGNSKYINFDLKDFYNTEPKICGLFAYLMLQRIVEQLKGEPTIIFLSKCDIFFRCCEMTEALMSKMTSMNAILICCVSDKSLIDSNAKNYLLMNFTIQFFTSDRNITTDQAKTFALTEFEANRIKSHGISKCIAFLKRYNAIHSQHYQFISVSVGMEAFDFAN